MAKALKTISVYRGDTWTRSWIVKKSSDGTPVDFTGATAKLHVKVDTEDSLPVISATTDTDDGLTFTLPETSGVLTLVMSAEKTALLAPDEKYIFDVEVTFPGGVVKTYEKALIEVEPDCTRSV